MCSKKILFKLAGIVDVPLGTVVLGTEVLDTVEVATAVLGIGVLDTLEMGTAALDTGELCTVVLAILETDTVELGCVEIGDTTEVSDEESSDTELLGDKVLSFDEVLICETVWFLGVLTLAVSIGITVLFVVLDTAEVLFLRLCGSGNVKLLALVKSPAVATLVFACAEMTVAVTLLCNLLCAWDKLRG